ncbi:hypothetical protein BHM03_00037760 [Ensete ventricosum]|nr:hypothetical protein BHM03_00037760 [Ensete ventricosum]
MMPRSPAGRQGGASFPSREDEAAPRSPAGRQGSPRPCAERQGSPRPHAGRRGLASLPLSRTRTRRQTLPRGETLISTVPPGSERSACRYPIRQARTTRTRRYRSKQRTLAIDISRFSNYEELREELGQMFGIEGLLEDPLRSGWQLVFVDRENDVLLLGDDPWESFVNNVWYIKILSPEDVLKMGKQGVDSFC